jgi:type VI secretion system secreted protein VgrG
VQFRALRNTPKPRVAGTMSAMVDAEGSGQYADLDEFGQYKVQLPFDRTDKSPDKGSARIRMASPYSGDGHGMHFPLHKSTEVLLSFTDGDPDQPVIVGAVPNSTHTNVVDSGNPRVNRLTTAGGNKISIDDTDGAQSVSLYSPHTQTSIQLGSSSSGDPGSSSGASGYNTMTLGGSNTLVIGQTNELAVGPYNVVCATGQTAVTFPTYNSVVVGTYLNAIAGNNVTWTYGPTLTMQSGTTASFTDSNYMQASEYLKFGGGLTALGITAYAATKPIAIATKVLLAVTALGNLAAGTAIAATVTAGKGDPLDIAYDEIPLALGANALSAKIVATLTQKLSALYAALSQISTLELSETGISMTGNFTPESVASLSMTPPAVELFRTSIASASRATLSMEDAGASLEFEQGLSLAKASMTAASASLLFGGASGESSVVVGPTIVSRCDTTTLTIQPASFTALVEETELLLTADGLLASSGTTTLMMGDDLAALSAGPNSVAVDAEGVNIMGTLIQLG